MFISQDEIPCFRVMEKISSSPCILLSLTTIQELSQIEPKLEVCKHLISVEDQWRFVWKSGDQCKDPCHLEEYFGRSQEWIDYNKPGTLSLQIYFVSNEVKVQEQYFIYSTVDLIGIVGGNLGLFIGFSFFDKIKQMISFITNRLQN